MLCEPNRCRARSGVVGTHTNATGPILGPISHCGRNAHTHTNILMWSLLRACCSTCGKQILRGPNKREPFIQLPRPISVDEGGDSHTDTCANTARAR